MNMLVGQQTAALVVSVGRELSEVLVEQDELVRGLNVLYNINNSDANIVKQKA